MYKYKVYMEISCGVERCINKYCIYLSAESWSRLTTSQLTKTTARFRGREKEKEKEKEKMKMKMWETENGAQEQWVKEATGSWNGVWGKYAITWRPLINPTALTVTGHAAVPASPFYFIYTYIIWMCVLPPTHFANTTSRERKREFRSQLGSIYPLSDVRPQPTRSTSTRGYTAHEPQARGCSLYSYPLYILLYTYILFVCI